MKIMKIKRFNESFNDLLEDPMGFGKIGEIQQNAVYLEKDESAWGEDDEYMIYLGPCDNEDTLSDSISFTDEFIEDTLNSVGITNYELYCSENAHILHFDSMQEANNKFDALVNKLTSDGYQIKN
jgi:hypothetical protein